MEDKIMKVMGEMYDPSKAEMMARICDCMGVTPEEWAQIRQMVRRVEAVEGRCTSVVHSCATQENLLKMACCPANMMYSQITVDKFSHQNQVPVLTPVTGLGGDYVDSLPLPPGKKIRFRQERRPGYSPKQVTVAQNLANDGKNYLDIAVTFHVSSDPLDPGDKIGSVYRGFQFFNNEGIPTPQPFPTYRNLPVTVGTQEYLIIELHHQGSANNLVSAFLAAHVNSEGWFAACGITDKSC
jgi:hypothetical protein